MRTCCYALWAVLPWQAGRDVQTDALPLLLLVLPDPRRAVATAADKPQTGHTHTQRRTHIHTRTHGQTHTHQVISSGKGHYTSLRWKSINNLDVYLSLLLQNWTTTTLS